jgi:hypothetical protein
MSTVILTPNLKLLPRVQPHPFKTPQSVVHGMNNHQFQYNTPESRALLAHKIAIAQNEMNDGRRLTLHNTTKTIGHLPLYALNGGCATCGGSPKIKIKKVHSKVGCGLCTGLKNCKCSCCLVPKQRLQKKKVNPRK